MKTIIITSVFAMVGLCAFSQVTFNGPSQFGDHNTQNNNFGDAGMNRNDSLGMMNFIKEQELDSNFIPKYFIIFPSATSNHKIEYQIGLILTKNGFIEKPFSGLSMLQIQNEIQIDIDKRDSSLDIRVGNIQR